MVGRPTVGSLAPTFTLDGIPGPRSLADLAGAPALVVFYRGHW